MKLSSFLNQLPAGGRSDFAKHIGVAPAYLYQMVNGIRPISPKRALLICEFSDWQVTPHELRPDIYPISTDGIPEKRLAELIDSGAIKPSMSPRYTQFSGSGSLYSASEEERRRDERRQAERREQERREGDRRNEG